MSEVPLCCVVIGEGLRGARLLPSEVAMEGC